MRNAGLPVAEAKFGRCDVGMSGTAGEKSVILIALNWLLRITEVA
jgi:hypothetical protein